MSKEGKWKLVFDKERNTVYLTDVDPVYSRDNNYQPKIREFVSRHPEMNGKAWELYVGHDPWCSTKLRHIPVCDCDPEIRKKREINPMVPGNPTPEVLTCHCMKADIPNEVEL